MIKTLLITVAVEAVVDLLFCRIKRKPIISILTTGLWANLWTQTGLWLLLSFLPGSYLPILISAEVLIWFIEGLCFIAVSRNRLRIREAMLLSLLRNLISFGIGAILPI